MKRCPKCNRVYGDYERYCLNDNYPLVNYSKEESYNNQMEKRKLIQEQKESNKPKCPTCQSTNIKKISALSRGAHAYAFGLFSKTARSQFECLNCGYKF